MFCALAGICSGCADMPRPPWVAKKSTDEEDLQISGVRNPTLELERLEELAEDAEKKDTTEQEAISQQLAQQLAAESDPVLRIALVNTLAAYPTSTASVMLKQGLRDTNKNVRVRCCEVLGERRDPECGRLLSEVIATDTDIDVRLAATRALGELEDDSAVNGLALALDDPDPAMRRRAITSLQSVTGREYGGDITAWRQYVQGNEPQVDTPSLAERFREIF